MLDDLVPVPIVQSLGVSVAYQQRATGPTQLCERRAADPYASIGRVLNCTLQLGNAIRMYH